jgi:hypothetical protein
MNTHSVRAHLHPPQPLAVLVAALRYLRRHAVTTAHERSAHPWLAMVAVPLATMIALLGDQWWTVPVFAFCAWWWAPHDDPWAWLVGAQAGIVGTAWAVIGATTLADLPDDRFIVGTIWIAGAGMLALTSAYSRRRGRGGY